MTITKKESDAFVHVSDGKKLVRTTTPVDLQVGTPGQPAELQLNGRFSQSLQTISVKPGSKVTYDNNATILCVKTVGTANYNVAVPQTAVTISLPANPRPGQNCIVKDATGTASTYNIVLVPGKAGVLIEQNTSFTLSTNFEVVCAVFDGSNWFLTNRGSGAIGKDGVQGPTGPQGPQGPAGVGIVGPQGPQGPRGYPDGLIVAVGEGTNSIAYSYDGINWTGLGNVLDTGYGVATNGSMWVAVGHKTVTLGGDTVIYNIAYSSNGINWRLVVNPFGVDVTLKSVAWCGPYAGWIAVGARSTVARSYDGVIWYDATTPIRGVGEIDFLCVRSYLPKYCLAVGRGVYLTDGAFNKQPIAVSLHLFRGGSASGSAVTTVESAPVDETINSSAYFRGIAWTGKLHYAATTPPYADNPYDRSLVIVGDRDFGGSNAIEEMYYSENDPVSGALLFKKETATLNRLSSLRCIAWNGLDWVAGGIEDAPNYRNFLTRNVDLNVDIPWTRDASNKVKGGVNDVCWTGKGWVAVGTKGGGDTTIVYSDTFPVIEDSWTSCGSSIFTIAGRGVACASKVLPYADGEDVYY